MEHRHSRQIPLLGQYLQDRLKTLIIGIVGLGALGSNALNILARMGAKKIVIIDRDIVEMHNIHRCSLYDEGDVGLPKAYAAYVKALRIDKEIVCSYHICDIHDGMGMLDDCDIVLECLDSIDSRRALSYHLRKEGIPWVHGAIVRNYGEVMLFQGNYCYNCYMRGKHSDENCSLHGVHPSLCSIVAALQCHITMEFLSAKSANSGYLLRINLDDYSMRRLLVDNNCDCKSIEPSIIPLRSCSKNVFIFRLKEDDYEKIISDGKLNKEIEKNHFCKINNIIVTDSRRAIVNSDDEASAERDLKNFMK